MRVGVHTDQVVIADAPPAPHGTAPALQGEAPGVASWLASQVRPGQLLRNGQPLDVTYVFKHVLLQNAAYHSQLRSTRRRYHHRVVQVLLEQFPGRAKRHPELLAWHSIGAGCGAPP